MDQAEIPPESILEETDLPPDMTVAPPLKVRLASIFVNTDS